MIRKFKEDSLLIASGNQGKVKEIKALLAHLPINIVSTKDFDLEEPEETGKTFIENAVLKAKYYGENTGLPALADDSGLAVDLLDGAPGIYSARWAGESKDFTLAFSRIQQEIKEKQSTQSGDVLVELAAHFVCALSLWWPDGHTESVEGTVNGHLTFPPRGNLGFGYDSIFIAEGHNVTFAEMPPEEKHQISHRANAFKKLLAQCF